jgi:hypothetical protein
MNTNVTSNMITTDVMTDPILLLRIASVRLVVTDRLRIVSDKHCDRPRIALTRLSDRHRVFACFGQTVQSPISDPLGQIGVAVAWYRRVMVVLGEVKIMRSLGDATVR